MCPGTVSLVRRTLYQTVGPRWPIPCQPAEGWGGPRAPSSLPWSPWPSRPKSEVQAHQCLVASLLVPREEPVLESSGSSPSTRVSRIHRACSIWDWCCICLLRPQFLQFQDGEDGRALLTFLNSAGSGGVTLVTLSSRKVGTLLYWPQALPVWLSPGVPVSTQAENFPAQLCSGWLLGRACLLPVGCGHGCWAADPLHIGRWMSCGTGQHQNQLFGATIPKHHKLS